MAGPSPEAVIFDPQFDVSLSDNFGYVYTCEEVANVIKRYEVETVSSFVLLNNWETKQNPDFGHGNLVYWNDVDVKHATVPAASIEFDGVPFFNVGTTTYECHHGRDWREKSKAQKKEMRKEAGRREHGYSGTKSRRSIQPTKKLDCPARLIVREVVKYPAFKISSDSTKERKQTSQVLRKALKDDTGVQGEKRFYIYLPREEEHKGIHGTLQDDADAQRLDPSIIKKIHDVVSTFEVRTVSEMQLILKHFVQHDLNMQPSPTEDNRRFYPRPADIRYHMLAAEKSIRRHANDQENLEILIDEWKEADSEKQQFYFRKYQEGSDSEESSLLFVHQTVWQQELLLKYGQEICLLDATFKTVRYALPIFFVAVKSNTGYIIVGTFLTQDEKTESIKEALGILKKWNPGWSPEYFMTDCADQEINAIEGTFQDSRVLICDFHRAQAWERWTNRLENGVRPMRDEVLAKINRVAQAVSIEEFTEALDSLKGSSVWKSNQRFRNWFGKEWLPSHQRWAWAFRQDRFLASVNTNNGIERQNRAFKEEYIRKRYKLPLSQMVRILVHEFLPNSWKKYRLNNYRASERARKYSKDVPLYLHNRPHSVIKFCLDQIEKSQSLKAADIKDEHDGFKVRSTSRPTEHYSVRLAQPRCTCYTWRRNGLPCKHMFAVFCHTDTSWQDLPAHYRESPFLTLDLQNETNNGNDERPLPIVHAEPRSDSEMDTADGEEYKYLTQDDVEEKDIQNKDSCSVTRLAEQCRETLRDLRECSFLCQDRDVLTEINDTLRNCAEKLHQSVPNARGLPLLPSPKKPTCLKRKSLSMSRSLKTDPLRKFARKSRVHPYTGRVGSKASLMRKNYMTSTPIDKIGDLNPIVKSASCSFNPVHGEPSKKNDDMKTIRTGDMRADERESENLKTQRKDANPDENQCRDGTRTQGSDLEQDSEKNDGEEYEKTASDTERNKFVDRHQLMYARHGIKVTESPVVWEIADDESSEGEDVERSSWLQVGRITLNHVDESILKIEHKWLNDNIVSAAQFLLKKKYPSVNGLEDPLKAQNLSFDTRPPFVQILNTEGNHWLTVACLLEPYNTIKVYDSLNRKTIPPHLADILACMMCTKGEQFLVCLEQVEEQRDNSSCGLFAIAYAADLCEKQRDPRMTKYDSSRLRHHLSNCLESNIIVPFPSVGTRRRRVGTLENIQVYCHCRLTWNCSKVDVKMIECCQCFEWCHYPSCEEPPKSAVIKKAEWFCKVCKPIIKGIKNGKWDV